MFLHGVKIPLDTFYNENKNHFHDEEIYLD